MHYWYNIGEGALSMATPGRKKLLQKVRSAPIGRRQSLVHPFFSFFHLPCVLFFHYFHLLVKSCNYECRAAVTIQRRYREWKSRRAGKRAPIRIPTPSTTPCLPTDRRTPLSGRFNYESYLMNRRPLSSAFSRFSPLPGTRARPPSADIVSINCN